MVASDSRVRIVRTSDYPFGDDEAKIDSWILDRDPPVERIFESRQPPEAGHIIDQLATTLLGDPAGAIGCRDAPR